MLLAKRNQDLMPSLLNEWLNMNWNEYVPTERNAMPKMNIIESDADYQLELCVPGLSKDDLKISIDGDNNLVVEMLQKTEENASEAKSANAQEPESRHYLRREFETLHFKQLYSLPENVKKESIGARVVNGILYITLPKFTEQEKLSLMQQIEIQ